tara:strand:- start:999 stop:1172 length:174 start_codon:yes stop_codon:yes gene_type:complete
MIDETVDLVEINISARSFTLLGSHGSRKVIDKLTVTQFMSVLEVIRAAEDETEIIYS